MSRESQDLRNSALLLTGANVICAAIGMSQGLIVLRLLGATLFGAAAVIVAFTVVAVNIVDVRLTDLISKLYFDERAHNQETGAAYRVWTLRFGLRLSALGAALIALLSFVVLALGARRFTDIPLSSWWLAAAALAQGASYLASFFIFIQRLAVPPRQMAWLQLGSAAINAAAMIGAIAVSPTLGGYVTGLMASAAGIAALNGWATRGALRYGVSRLDRASAPAVDRREIVSFLAAGNVLGYVKVLHRAADVLLVAFFCSDGQTGVYKLARSLADALYVVSEAAGRVYQPRFLALLQSNNQAEYGAIARWMMTAAAAITVAAVAAELLLLPHVAGILGVQDTGSLTASVAVLSISFFFVAGLQSWMWPVFVAHSRLASCTVWTMAAVIVGQYVIGPALFHGSGNGSAVWFCVGYLASYPLSALPLWFELRRDGLIWISRPQEAVAS